MYSTTGIFLLSIFAVFKTANSQESRTVYSTEAQEKDVDSLLSITWQEALPLIIFETEDRKFFRYPAGLEKAQIKDGRLVTGTEFIKPTQYESEPNRAVSPTRPQIHLCPNSNTIKGNCLVPTQFGESQILQCEREPIPVMEADSLKIKCGLAKTGTMIRFLYKICPLEEPYRLVKRSIVIYSFCYDKTANKILFVGHNLSSVELLSEKLLTREREIKSEPSRDTYKLIDPKYYEFLDSTAEAKSQYYRFQMLAPTDNMALATWRKTTYQYVNMALQHRALFELWNEINNQIRNHAIKSAGSPRKIMTGVFDIPNDKLPNFKDDNQIFNIWITTVVDMNGNPLFGKIALNAVRGIAILMNNFIWKDGTSALKQYIDEICGTDLCVYTLIRKFTDVRGEVRCCKLTEKISRLFWGDGDAPPNLNHCTSVILLIDKLAVEYKNTGSRIDHFFAHRRSKTWPFFENFNFLIDSGTLSKFFSQKSCTLSGTLRHFREFRL